MFPHIQDLIPQRPPFLFVDIVTDRSETTINTTYQVTGNEDFFRGHFPGNPIMPGVLLQEALFQSGAALMAGRTSSNGTGGGLGVVARVSNAKFKNMVRPGDLLEMQVELIESISNAHLMKGITKSGGKTVLVIEFTVASV